MAGERVPEASSCTSSSRTLPGTWLRVRRLWYSSRGRRTLCGPQSREARKRLALTQASASPGTSGNSTFTKNRDFPGLELAGRRVSVYFTIMPYSSHRESNHLLDDRQDKKKTNDLSKSSKKIHKQRWEGNGEQKKIKMTANKKGLLSFALTAWGGPTAPQHPGRRTS